MSDPRDNEEAQGSQIRSPHDLPASERRRLYELVGGGQISFFVDSDLLFQGRYGESRLVLTDEEVVVLEDGVVRSRLRLDDLASVSCKDFVGNGVLEARTKADRRFELVRYSGTTSQAFHEMADRINQLLSVSESDLEIHQEEIAKSSGPKEGRLTYRCPNCGYPLMNPFDACPRCTSKKRVMVRLARMMRDDRRLLVVSIALAFVFTAAALAPGLLLKYLVDDVLAPVNEARKEAREQAEGGGQEVGAINETEPPISDEEREMRKGDLLMIVGLLFLAFTVARLTAHFRIRAMGTLGERVVMNLRNRLYRTLQRLSLSYYDREHTGRIMARVLSDTRVVQRFVVQAAQDLVIDILTVIGIAVVLFVFKWKLAAIALVPMPFVVLCARYFSHRFRGVFRAVRRKFANLSASVSETVSGVRVVKSFGQEDREITGFNEKSEDVYNARMSAVSARARFGPAVGFMLNLGMVAVWIVGGWEVLYGTLTLGTLLLFWQYMPRFFQPVRRLMNVTEAFQESATAAERIFNVMNMPSEVADHEDAVEVENVKGRVDIENVSFGYGENERVLKNIDLHMEPGEMIGLVGQTGSGKSTLVSLVCRFYDPDKGRILLDGHDLRDVKIKSLRGHIGMVLQDPFLFAGTIKENIAYGKPDADAAEIIRAAKAANSHDFIMNLPDGYDSQVGERGVRLSGGERQRISIARAILKNPALLILDEATSSVDTATEAVIQEAMDRVVAGRTTIAIAHRLSTLRNADRLVVLDEGEIVEQGTHDELIRAGGRYARLCRIQSELTPVVPDN